jgi:phosphohistidine phosphatase
MDLYLVQHGESAPEREDPARPLTERGRQEVERVARTVARLRLALDLAAIHHSGKLRAQQTAEILAEHLQPARGAVQADGLAPMDDPAIARQAVEQASGSMMVVGHLPHLSRLASLLLVGDPAREVVAFRMGGIVCLGRDAAAGTGGKAGPAGASGAAAGTAPGAAAGGAGDEAGTAPGAAAGEAGSAWRLRWFLTPELAYT